MSYNCMGFHPCELSFADLIWKAMKDVPRFPDVWFLTRVNSGVDI